MIPPRLFQRQKTRPVNGPFLRQIIQSLLEDNDELGIHLINASEMAVLNETFLRHDGSTDVITFNHRDQSDATPLYGEIFISMDDIVAHARSFRVTWQSELARCVIHGILHLRGHDDLKPALRRAMKREENRLLKALSRRFDLGKLDRSKHAAQRK